MGSSPASGVDNALAGCAGSGYNGRMVKDDRADRLMRHFGRRLRAARITAGYDDASDFASDLGIEPPRYRKYERGESMPPLDILAQIVQLTDRGLDWLLLGRDGKPKK